MKNARKFTAALLAFFLVFNVTPPMASAIEEETGPIDNGTAWESVSSCTESETLYTAAENESSISVGGESFSTSDSTEQERAGTTWSFPEGTYAFRNYGNTNRWMDIQQNLTTPGAHVQQYAFGSSPADVYSASGLFKVTKHQGASNTYIIRLVLNPNLTFDIASDGSVVTKEIPANDEDVNVNDAFIIIKTTNGYRIRTIGTSKYIGANATTASGAAGAPDSFLIGMQYNDLNTHNYQATWVPEGYITLIDEGIYAFKNDGNTNRWMDTQGDSDEAGAHILQYAYGTSPADSFSRGGLFKISRVGDTGRYIIRLMTNNLLTLSVSGSEIITKTISPYDSQVAAADTFHIIYYKDTYMIRPYNSSYVITAKNSTASGSAGAPNSYLTTVAKSSATVRARWEMEKFSPEIMVKLEVTYDYAYSQRHSNPSGRINDQIHELQDKYWDEFGIFVNCTPQRLSLSYVDTYCTSDYDEWCTCVGNSECHNSGVYEGATLYTYHHSNLQNILARISFPDTEKAFKMLYLGHNFCLTDEGTHHTNTANGYCFEWVGIMTITAFAEVFIPKEILAVYSEETTRQLRETLTTIHEFGHMYGAKDHYGQSAPTTEQANETAGYDKYDDFCIYGSAKWGKDILGNYTICDGCKEDIEANIQEYNHQ